MNEQFRFASADQLVAEIEGKLRTEGATFDDLDGRIAAELGVSLDEWCGYAAVCRAAHDYQMALWFSHLGLAAKEERQP